MTIHISHSRVYGTTDWFDGEPDIYSITEIEADCLPESAIMRNSVAFSNTTIGLMTDDADQAPSDFSDQANLTELLIVSQTSTGPAPTAHDVLSSENYVYTCNPVYTSGNVIREVDILTEAVSTMSPETGYAFKHITLIEDRKVAAIQMNSSSSSWLLTLHDFGANTTDILFTSETENIVRHGFISYNVNGAVKSIFVFHRACGDDTCIVASIYNHSTDVRIEEDLTLPAETNAIYWYSSPVLVSNKLIFNLILYNSNPGQTWFCIVDLATNTMTNVAHVPADASLGEPEVYDMAAHGTLGRVYFNMYYREDGIDFSVGYIDLSDDSINFIRDDATYYWGMIHASDKCYLYKEIGSGETSIFEVTDLDTPIIQITGLSELINISNNLCTNVDEGSNRIWVWDDPNQELRGYSIAAGTYITLETTIPSSDTFPYRTTFTVHGKKILFTVHRPSANTSEVYLLHSPEA